MAAGKALRYWAIDAGKSVKELASLFNVSRVTVGRWLNCHFRPDADQRVAIARATNGKIPVEAWSDGDYQLSWALGKRAA